MFLLASASRQAFRRRQMAERLGQLADVQTERATSQAGRVITVVVRRPAAGAGPDQFNLLQYIRPWWTTINKIGLRGTVLYSGLNDDQVAAATTEHIDFVPVDPGPKHIFHERHFLVRDFVRSIDDPYIVVTDASDVAFKRDPFPLMRRPSPETLFVGREKRRIGWSRCLRNEMRQQFGRLHFPFRPVLNPGILGGSRETVLRALDEITGMIIRFDGHLAGSDMSIVNRTLYESFSTDDIVTGEPLHSRFKGWEFHTGAAILHK